MKSSIKKIGYVVFIQLKENPLPLGVRTGGSSISVDCVTEAVMAVGVEVSGQASNVGVNIRGVVIRVAGQVSQIKLDVTGVPTAELIRHRLRN